MRLAANYVFAGAVIVRGVNMHEVGSGSSGFNAHHGPARNPHHFNHWPGGSSSGSASLVAAGVVPLSIGESVLGIHYFFQSVFSFVSSTNSFACHFHAQYLPARYHHFIYLCFFSSFILLFILPALSRSSTQVVDFGCT